jgi:hypothetical protein
VNDNNDFNKNRFDAYLKLADYWAGSYQLRNEVEWKVGLGLWAVILTSIVSSDKLPPIPHSARWLVFVWFVYVVLWVGPLSLMKMHERGLSHQYADKATALISAEKVGPPWRIPYTGFFHALTTGVLLLALNCSLKH